MGEGPMLAVFKGSAYVENRTVLIFSNSLGVKRKTLLAVNN